MPHTPPETASRLTGVIAFPVTPFHPAPEQNINWRAFEAGVDFIVSGGIDAIVVAGGTGELFSLSPKEIVEAADRATKVVHERAIVLVGVGFGPLVGRELAVAVEEVGADGVVILPPYYPTPDATGLVDYYARIAEAVPRLAVVPYSRAAARLTPEHLAKLARYDNIVAFKDGHGDVRMFQRNRELLGERFVWIAGAGDDLVGPYAAAGADGYTSSVACFDPYLARELWRLAAAGDFMLLRALSSRMVQPWYELRTRLPGYEVSVMKAAMESFGLEAGSVRPPLAPLTDTDRAEVLELSRRLGRFVPAS